MDSYYADQMDASKLVGVYDTGLQRIKQYLHAEIDYVAQRLTGNETVLEVGAGYGRIMKILAPKAARVDGIDNSPEFISYGRQYLRDTPNCRLTLQDAHRLTIQGEYDVVICLQNGLSAIKGRTYPLVARLMAALKAGGTLYVSTYSEGFWEHRLEWFREQADKGLLGKIDEVHTGNGIIVCEDGFQALTFTREDLALLGRETGYPYHIDEVDGSSTFLVIEKRSKT